MKLTSLILVIAAFVASTSCASAKKVKANKGEKEIEQLCNYTTDQTAYYANGVAESTDMQMAKDKAATLARAEMAQNIKVSVERFNKMYRIDTNGEMSSKLEDEVQTITMQTIEDSDIVCSRYVKLDNGKYRAYVSVKLLKKAVEDAIRETLKKDAKELLDQYQKQFEQAINEAITNSSK